MYNDEQLAVIDSTADQILVLAGAGTGKTQCMVGKVKSLVDDGVDPTSILVLTFTNAAAFEMKDRYIQMTSKLATGTKFSVLAAEPEFRTFHAFCYHLLTTDSDVLHKLKYSNIPQIADEVESARVDKEAMLQTGIKLSGNKLKANAILDNKDKMNLRILNAAKFRLLKSKNLITFDILSSEVCKLFVNDDEVVKKYKDKYKYLMIDEFQDTSPEQWDFAKSFTMSKILVVGDALQSLYSWRGADSTLIKSLADDDSWETHKLFRNYRSGEEICNYANVHSTYAGNTYRVAIRGQRPGGVVKEIPVTCVSFRGDIDDNSLAQVDSILSNPIKGTTAILCRTNAEVTQLKAHCKAKNFELSEVDEMNCSTVIRCAVDSKYMVSLLASKLPKDAYVRYLRDIAFLKADKLEMNEDIFLSSYKQYFPPNLLQDIVEVRKILANDKFGVLYIYNELKYYLKFTQDLDVMSIETIEDLISLLLDSLYNNILTSGSLYIGTVHSSKGLEYDRVLLMNVNTPSFRLDNEDNLNIHYVGVTRAKSELYVFRK